MKVEPGAAERGGVAAWAAACFLYLLINDVYQRQRD